jgi:hypothetical protein
MLHLKKYFLFYLIGFAIFSQVVPAFAQSSLEGRITDTINDLVRVLNLLILGFIAWSGFLIAKGDGSGTQRLIYGVVGLVVVNASNMIITFFS